MLKSLFGKKKSKKAPRGSHPLSISAIVRLTPETVKVVLDVPSSLTKDFQFVPGQYLTFILTQNGKEYRRSYSICSGPNEPVAVAVKKVPNGTISKWFNDEAEVGMELFTMPPEGNFTLPEASKIVAIAAGSGITPIMSMIKSLKDDQAMKLFYGNRKAENIIFRDEIDHNAKVEVHHYLSADAMEGAKKGRLNKDAFSEVIKSDLDILKSDCFLLCGPEEMIADVKDILNMFGVSEDKIKYELFTTPTILKSGKQVVTPEFNGTSHVTVILDHEKTSFELDGDGHHILDKAIDAGVDAPYSCKGGVCSSCKAKVLKGSASMTMNFSLTDKDIEEGYILTCQAHPASEELIITYDE